MREWVIYAAIMCVVFLLFFQGSSRIGIIGGLVASGPLYLAFGYALAKFGYQRKTLADLRTPRAAPSGSAPATVTASRPAPTRRTSGGTNRRPSPSRKRR